MILFMNQILYNASGKTSGPLPIDKLVKFFAICMIIFGLILFGEGTYKLFAVNSGDTTSIDYSVPNVEFSKDGNIATVSITHNKGIARIKYYWNDDEVNAKITRGDSNSEVLINNISIPSGINTLNVEATDDNGRSAKNSYEYSYDGIAIDFPAVINYSDLKIVASDVTGIAYMKYKWNNGEEVTVYPDEKGAISIEHQTEIPSGLNTLYVTAVNTSNITLNKKQEIKGNKRPEINWYIVGTELHVTVRDEEGIATITQQVNAGDIKTYEANGQKEFSYTYDVGDEHILVTITATDVEGIERTLKGKNY